MAVSNSSMSRRKCSRFSTSVRVLVGVDEASDPMFEVVIWFLLALPLSNLRPDLARRQVTRCAIGSVEMACLVLTRRGFRPGQGRACRMGSVGRRSQRQTTSHAAFEAARWLD